MSSSRYDKTPFYDVGPENGLHILRNKWGKKSHIEKQSKMLASGINKAIQATRKAVPNRIERGKSFLIDPTTHKKRKDGTEYNERSLERQIEQQIYRVCRPGEIVGSTDCWGQLIQYQVPLFNSNQRNGWGHIDLFALTSDGKPVVIELKKGDSEETPLRAMIEGLANSVAVEKLWKELFSELKEMRERNNFKFHIAEAATPITLVLAPHSYWDCWGVRGKFGKTVDKEARDSFKQLRDTFAREGYLTKMAAFDWPFTNDKPGIREIEVDW